MSKRVYKFISAEHGIRDLKDTRLKVSTLDDLNDPFDLYSIDTTDAQIAQAVEESVARLQGSTGLLCFSRNWDNLLLWSHYGRSHTGLCLGFDIPGDSPGASFDMDVYYQPSLLKIRDVGDVNPDLANRSLRTRHESWSYEQEVRVFVRLNDPPDKNGLFWFQFGADLQIREVIIGAQCRREDVNAVCEVLKGYPDQIECSWAYKWLTRSCLSAAKRRRRTSSAHRRECSYSGAKRYRDAVTQPSEQRLGLLPSLVSPSPFALS